jgi:vacuolar-type H+-ATPase subunit E/Vma4
MADAIERIVNKILDDARKQAEVYYQEAQRKIDEIRDEEYSLWDKEKQRLEAEYKREAEDIRIQILSRAHMEGKRALTSAREEVISKVLADILNNFRNSSGYGDYIKRSIEDARSILGNQFRIKCSPDDVELVRSSLGGTLSEVEVVPVEGGHGGIVVESSDGLRAIDYSVDALVGRRMQDVRKMILEKLFEGEYA